MRKLLPEGFILAVAVAALVSLAGAQSAKDFFDKGTALETGGKYAEAVAAFDRAVIFDPSFAEAFRHRGLCKSRLGDDTGALADYSRAVKLDPRNARAWNGMSAIKIRAKEYDLAFVYAVRAIDVDPKLSNAYINRGVVKEHQADFGGARADYDKAIGLDDNSAAGYFNRGLLRKKQNDFGGAIDDFTKVISIDKTYVKAYANRGDILGKIGEFGGAEADLRTALNLDPKNKDILTRMGEIQKQLEGQTRPSIKPQAAAAKKPLGKEGLRTASTPPAPATKPPSLPAVAPPPPADFNLPTIPFKPDQPCATAQLKVAGAPWQKAPATEKTRLPAGIEPADIPALPAVMEISRARYAGAVAAAKEGLRILYGPLSEAEAEKFEMMWAPLFDFPSPDIIDYLNTLNPLLVRYLAGREALARAGILFNSLIYEMGVVVGYGEESAFRDSLDMAGRQTEFILSLQTALTRLGGEIAALGNPPNPLQAKCEARRKHEKAIEAANVEAAAPGEIWEGTYLARFDPAVKAGTIKYYSKLEDEFGLRPGTIGVPMADLEFGRQPVVIMVMLRPELKSHDVFGLNGLRGICLDYSDYGPGLTAQSLVPENQTLKLEIYEPGNPAVLRKSSDGSSIPEAWTMAGATRLGNAIGAMRKAASADPANLGLRFNGEWSTDVALVQKQIENVLTFNKRRAAVLAAGQKYGEKPNPSAVTGERFSAFRSLLDESERIFAGAEAAETPSPSPRQEASEKAAAEAVREEIAYRKSMIELLKRNLEMEYKDLASEKDAKRKEAYAFRVLQIKSDIQAEQDLIASYETGKVVHTRSAFESYAHEKLLEDARREAVESDATWRISQRIDRQINLLPWDQRAAKKEQVHRLLDAKTVASGNLEKARKVASALNKEVEGYWAGQAARNEEAAVDAEQSEFYAKLAVMAAGMVFVGMSGPAFVETFGPAAGATIWAPTISGACYGGVTGYVEGGPGEALKQSLAWSSTLGFMTTEFYDGAKNAYNAPGGNLKKAFAGGVTQAGTAYLTGKAFEYGANLLGRGAQALFGKGGTPTTLRQFEDARFNQDLKDAKSLVGFYQEKEFQLLKARANNPPGSAVIQKAETEVQQLAASVNSSYHAKLYLKNEGAPGARRAFNRRIDAFYDEMMPGFLANLENKGYKMKRSDFTPMRNASSEGSVSMDLDLALNENSRTVILKDGEPVKLDQFMPEAQQALDQAYHAVTRTSAKRSSINLTTSIHSESFSDTRLLKHGVDFSQIKPEDIAQIGKVIQNKTINIEADPALSPVAKVQAGCRESNKEIGNMLLPYLEFKIKSAKTPAEVAEFRQAREHWSNIREKFVGLSQASSDGHKIWQLEQEISLLTGGKSARQTINELSGVFVNLSKSR
ncbi:MAG: tetratricopeptide repeat protein [Candidatus Aminicenantales bacterium]